MNKIISKKKQKLIDNFNKLDHKVGDYVYVKWSILNKCYDDLIRAEKLVYSKIINIDGNIVTLKDVEYRNAEYSININEIHSKYVRNIGADPFISDIDGIRTINYSLESILDQYEGKSIYKIGEINILPINWNPYIYNKDGVKEYYQRPFVWTLKDNQLLIESIYNGIECGRILVRLRSWKSLESLVANGETEISFKDIVDGKQRLNAIHGFINDEFNDMYGNFYSDLSEHSQNKFMNHQLFSYAEMSESTTDEQVIKQFLKVNFSGKPQSQKHIDYVKSILGNMK